MCKRKAFCISNHCIYINISRTTNTWSLENAQTIFAAYYTHIRMDFKYENKIPYKVVSNQAALHKLAKTIALVPWEKIKTVSIHIISISNKKSNMNSLNTHAHTIEAHFSRPVQNWIAKKVESKICSQIMILWSEMSTCRSWGRYSCFIDRSIARFRRWFLASTISLGRRLSASFTSRSYIGSNRSSYRRPNLMKSPLETGKTPRKSNSVVK